MNLCPVNLLHSNYLLELSQRVINPSLLSTEFDKIAFEIFGLHKAFNPVYAEWIRLLKIDTVNHLHEIPFLPVRFFKCQNIGLSAPKKQTEGIVFTSSTTTGSVPSKHQVPVPSLYENSFNTAFQHFYGSPSEMVILALLPGYLERDGSSLVYMVNTLIASSGKPESGFYLNDFEGLAITLAKLLTQGQRVLLLGVSFGLLDFIESAAFKSQQFAQTDNLTVMETGGMKGHRKELTRMELHDTLKNAFGVKQIHSEYGMTELLSQAYSAGEGLFECPPWMRICIRETDNPFQVYDAPKTSVSGGINIIDLANLFSCPFIAVDDIGKLHSDGKFEVLGRFDQADVRGCNLMIG